MSMKDMNSIKAVSIKEQRAIQAWYTYTKIGIVLTIIGMLCCHSMQLYSWYLIAHGLTKALCQNNEQAIQKEHDADASLLAMLRAYTNHVQKCVLLLDAWNKRIQGIAELSHLESATITPCTMEYIAVYPSIDACMNAIHRLSEQPDVVSAVCSSVKPHNTQAKLFLCTINCTYKNKKK